MKKYWAVLLICLTFFVVACSNDEISIDDSQEEVNRNLFLDYGDFTDYIDENTDVPIWNELCQEPFPDFTLMRSAKIDPNKPMVALTFDDGPNTHTERLLDIFEKNGGKGTFFVVGDTIDKREETLKRMAAEGHEIGNHSWTHTDLTSIDEKELVTEIMRNRERIYELTGQNCHLVRPPYGSHNEQMETVGQTIGVCYVNWSVDSVDWKSKNAQAVYKEIFDNVSNGSVILCHDLHKTTVDSMEQVIPQLIKDGYQLVTVSELLAYSKKTIEAGKVYYRQ